MGSSEPRMPPVAAPEAAQGGRNPADATALLVELGRLVKGRQFYPEGHPQLRDLHERGFRAFEADLERSGPLAIEIRQGSFRLGGEPVGRGRVDDLAQDLVRRAVRQLRFDPTLTQAALERFVATLAADRDATDRSGGFVTTLYTEPCPGITVNEMDYAAAIAQAGQPRGADSSATCEDAAGGTCGVAGLPGSSGADSGESCDGGAEGDAGDAVAAALGALASEKPEPLPLSAQLEQAPLDALYDDDRADALVRSLRELDAVTEDARYRDLAREVSVLAATLSDEGLRDEGYRAILVLAAHAADRERSESLRTLSLECLRELARGSRLDDLIDRSCSPGDGAGLRSAQILLRLGAAAAPALLRRVEAEQDLDRRGQLYGILIALGDAATDELRSALGSGERRRSGVAVRLAGEMQNEALVDDLAALLAHEDGDLRREAAKALVRIGSAAAIEVLVDALESPIEGMPGHAAFCLGVAGGGRALEVLVATLRRESARGSFDLAREAVRALGRLGRPEAAPELGRVLARRSLLRKRPLRELQIAAVGALAKLPGDAARTTLELAARRGPGAVREAARQALARGETPRAEAP